LFCSLKMGKGAVRGPPNYCSKRKTLKVFFLIKVFSRSSRHLFLPRLDIQGTETVPQHFLLLKKFDFNIKGVLGEAQIISLSNHFLSSSRNFSLQFTLGKKKTPSVSTKQAFFLSTQWLCILDHFIF